MKKRILSVVLAMCLCLFFQPSVYAFTGGTLPEEHIFSEESISRTVLYSNSTISAPTEIYAAMTALKDDERYPEGKQ